jgi:hypothetical protein
MSCILVRDRAKAAYKTKRPPSRPRLTLAQSNLGITSAATKPALEQRRDAGAPARHDPGFVALRKKPAAESPRRVVESVLDGTARALESWFEPPPRRCSLSKEGVMAWFEAALALTVWIVVSVPIALLVCGAIRVGEGDTLIEA